MDNMKAYGDTNKGLKRENNQDTILVNDRMGLFIVADGMGGHAHGEVASQMTAKSINDCLTQGLLNASPDEIGNQAFLEDQIRSAIIEANTRVLEASRENPRQEVMGTTVSVLLIRDGWGHTGHVGDSRIYRLRDGSFTRLTKDHTQAQELVDAELLSENEAENHRLSHVLTRAVGSSPKIAVDIDSFEIGENDTYLLASDGLFRVLNESAVHSVLLKQTGLEEKGRELIRNTLDGGAPDNVSVILVQPGAKARRRTREKRSNWRIAAMLFALALYASICAALLLNYGKTSSPRSAGKSAAQKNVAPTQAKPEPATTEQIIKDGGQSVSISDKQQKPTDAAQGTQSSLPAKGEGIAKDNRPPCVQGRTESPNAAPRKETIPSLKTEPISRTEKKSTPAADKVPADVKPGPVIIKKQLQEKLSSAPEQTKNDSTEPSGPANGK